MNKNKKKNLLKVLGIGAGVLAVAGVAFTFIVGLNGATYDVNESDSGATFTNPNSEVVIPQTPSAVSESSLNTTVGSLDSISPASTSTEKNAVIKEVAVTAQVPDKGSNVCMPLVGEVTEPVTEGEGEIEDAAGTEEVTETVTEGEGEIEVATGTDEEAGSDDKDEGVTEVIEYFVNYC